LVGLVIAMSVANLEFVPNWRSLQALVVHWYCLASFAGVILFAGVTLRPGLSIARFLAVLLVGALWLILSIANVFQLSIKDGFMVGGRELEQEIHADDAGVSIYVYTHVVIPDGFDYTSIMVRDSWLPLMREAMTLDSTVRRTRRRGNRVYFLDDRSDSPIGFYELP
jgi:hypothetical protein